MTYYLLSCRCSTLNKPMGRSRGGDRGSRPSLENRKNIGFLSNANTGPDPLKNYKVNQASIQFLAIIDISLAGRWWPANSGIYLDRLSPLIKLVKVRPPLTKLSGSAHVNQISNDEIPHWNLIKGFTVCQCTMSLKNWTIQSQASLSLEFQECHWVRETVNPYQILILFHFGYAEYTVITCIILTPSNLNSLHFQTYN